MVWVLARSAKRDKGGSIITETTFSLASCEEE